jgi:hypothetical protein
MTAQSDQTKIELIGKDIEYIKRDIGLISSSMKELSGLYITTKEYNDYKVDVEKRFLRQENNRHFWKFLTPVLTSVLTAVLTFLVMFYIQNAKL